MPCLQSQRPGSGYRPRSPQGSPAPCLPTSQGPQSRLPGLGRAMPPAPSRNKQRCQFRGRADSWGPGWEGWCPHAAPAPPGLWPGPVGCGRGPAPRPLASSGNQPGLREPAPRGPGPGGWEWPSRLPSQGWGHPGAASLSRSQNRGCNPGAEEGQAPSPTLKGTPSPGCPLAPRGPTQWAPGCGQRRQGSVPVSPMATHSGCSLWGPTCLS